MGIKDKDQEYQPPEFKNWDDGTYVATGIAWADKFRDKQGNPIFKEGGDGRVGIIGNFIIKGQEDEPGPPYRVFEHTLGALVHAFGGNAAELGQYQDQSRKLLHAETVINNSNKEVEIKVSGGNGFVGWVTGMTPPAGHYHFRYAGMSKTQNEQTEEWEVGWEMGRKFSDSDDQERRQFRLQLEIMGDFQGKPTPFDGFRVTFWERYALNYIGDGQLEWNTSPKQGNMTADAYRMQRLLQLFAPSLWEQAGEYDFAPGNPDAPGGSYENILPYIDLFARADSTVVFSTLGYTDKGNTRFGWDTAQIVGGGEVQTQEDLGSPALDTTYEIMTHEVHGLGSAKAVWADFPTNTKYTPEAIVWLREHVLPIWEQRGFPVGPGNSHDLKDLTDTQVADINHELKTKFALKEADATDVTETF